MPESPARGPVTWMRRSGRVALFLVPFALTLEVGTRVEQALSYGAPFFGDYSYESALRTRSENGIVGRPNGRYEKWTLNSWGFRGPEFGVSPSPGVTRIACVGASETFGLFEREGEEWPRQLERELTRSGHDVEVLNAALAGMTLERRIEHFRERVLPLKPDVVLVMLEYPSIVGAAGRSAPVAWGSGTGRPISDSALAGLRLRFLRKLKDALLPRLPSWAGDLFRRASAQIRVLKQRWMLGSDFQGIRTLSPGQIRFYRQEIGRFLDLVEGEGTHVLFLAPAVRMDEDTALDYSANWPFIHPDWLLEAREILLEETVLMADPVGVPVMDLDRVVGQDEEALMADTFHFTEAGAERVASAVAERLESLPGWFGGEP